MQENCSVAKKHASCIPMFKKLKNKQVVKGNPATQFLKITSRLNPSEQKP